jgi:outer membrane translocation and assembly module TamA
VLEVMGSLDLPQTLGTKNRVTLSGGYSRNTFDPYYGVSNAAAPDPSLPSSYYAFDLRVPSVSAIVRRPLWGSLSAFVGYRFEWLSVRVRPNSLLADQGYPGLDNARYAELFAGVLLDTRDIEADPREGHLIELSVRGAASPLGSQFAAVHAYGSAAFYRTILPNVIPRLVLAGRVGAQISGGDIPLPILADFGAYSIVQGLGGASTLRGFFLQQFIGRGKLMGNLELRWRFFDTWIKGHPFGLSAVAFVDSGRVFAEPGPDSTAIGGLHTDTGLGARITWEEVFVLRFDAGWSPNQVRFFVTLGQLF